MTIGFRVLLAMLALGLALPAQARSSPEAACAELARTAAPAAAAIGSVVVGAGAWDPAAGAMAFFARMPGMNPAGHVSEGPNVPFCRVFLTLRPTPASDIRVELWLPLTGWNGKFMAAGNFGWGGTIMHPLMLAPLQQGYAVASTDTGHDSATSGQGGAFALGQPEKLIDYAWRADHAMTVAAKALIRAFYGRGPVHSYWVGCSLGGLEGLIEAKRFPADYDGIVAGAPPNPLTAFNAAQLWPSALVRRNPAGLIPKEKLAMVHAAVLKACATPIGQQEGVVDRPLSCAFDPGTLRCNAGDGADCLTGAQVDLLRQVYAGPVNPRTGAILFPGPAHGSELELEPFISAKPFPNALDLFRYVAFADPDWDPATLDWDAGLAAAMAKVGPLLHVDADLRPFFARGGRLLLYIGWNDYHHPAELADYYARLVRTAGPASARSVRLFTIPGMGHCFGGAGCDTFDKLGTIDTWVSTHRAPERITASRVEAGKVIRTRPICSWPLLAGYRGAGATETAESFACVADPPR